MNRASTTVSVVIPAHNASATLGGVLQAVLGQERPDQVALEVIVVNDGSDDDTAGCARRFSEVLLVEGEQQGPSGARNNGASRASGEILVFLDSDDQPLDGWLRQIAEAFESDHVGFATWPALVAQTGADRTEAKTWYPDRHGPDGVLALAGCFGLRRFVFDDIGGYDPVLRVGENSDLCRRARVRCGELGLETRRLDVVTIAISFGKPPSHYDRQRLEAIEHLLVRDAAEYVADPERAGRAYGIAAVNAGRCGEWGRARRHAVAAIKVRPRERRNYGRLLLACLPPLGQRRWAAEGRRSRVDGS